MEKQKIRSVSRNTLNEQDRLTIAQLLIKAGYTVRLSKEKKENSSSAEKIIEYWEE